MERQASSGRNQASLNLPTSAATGAFDLPPEPTTAAPTSLPSPRAGGAQAGSGSGHKKENPLFDLNKMQSTFLL